MRSRHRVVAPGAEYLVVSAQFNARIHSIEDDVIVGVIVVAERFNIARQRFGDRLSMSIIMCDEQSTALLGWGQQSREFPERFDDRLEVAVDIQA